MCAVVWSVGSGFLTGRYTRQDPSGGHGRIEDFNFIPIDREKGYTLIDLMKTVAAAHRASVAQVALAWLLAKPGVSTVLLGASKMSQLEDNLGAAELGLTADEMQQLEQATAPPRFYPNWFTRRPSTRKSAKRWASRG